MKEDMYYRLDSGEPEEAGRASGTARNPAESPPEASTDKIPLFWRFPGGKGSIQPWRRRLWELQNNSDRE